MLGVPATLLDPAEAADSFAASTLEGFSLPPIPPALHVHSGFCMLLEVPLATHRKILPDSLFHPPLG